MELSPDTNMSLAQLVVEHGREMIWLQRWRLRHLISLKDQAKSVMTLHGGNLVQFDTPTTYKHALKSSHEDLVLGLSI